MCAKIEDLAKLLIPKQRLGHQRRVGAGNVVARVRPSWQHL
jgi:hypothetical protein